MKWYICYVKTARGWLRTGGQEIRVNNGSNAEKVLKAYAEHYKKNGCMLEPVSHVVFYPIQDIMP